mgnify:FL=1
MNEIIEESNLTKIGEVFNQFSPHGVTGIFLLQESHLSAHSWPEKNYLALDLFSCIPLQNIVELEQIIRKNIGIVRIDFKMIERGEI